MEWETELRSRPLRGLWVNNSGTAQELQAVTEALADLTVPARSHQGRGGWLISDFCEKLASLHFPTHAQALRPFPQPLGWCTGQATGGAMFASFIPEQLAGGQVCHWLPFHSWEDWLGGSVACHNVYRKQGCSSQDWLTVQDSSCYLGSVVLS